MSLDNAAMTVYGDSISGNCLKVKFVAARLGLPFDWVEVSVLAKQTRTPEFLAINPAGQVPVVRFADNNVLAQSKAIILHLAVGSDLIPGDAFERAQMYQWLFWEQYSHETAIAQRRYFVGEKLSLADIALVAYTRFAHQASIDLAQYPHEKNWLRRIETDLNIEPAQ